MIKTILEALAAIARLITWIIRKVDNAKHERERDEIDRDPVDWFSRHFGMPDADGMRDSADEADVERDPK